MKKNDQLVKFAGFAHELAIAETIDEIKQLENKAAAVAAFAKKDGVGKKEQDEWGIFRTEIVARKGEWLDEFFPYGATKEKPRNTKVKVPNRNLKMPATKKESSQARTIKREPELVDQAINTIKKDKKQVVTPTSVENLVKKEKKKITAKDPANIKKKQQEEITKYFADTNSALNKAMDRLTLIVQGDYKPVNKTDYAHIVGIRNNLYAAIRLAIQVGIDVPKVYKTYVNKIEIAEHLTLNEIDKIEEAQIVP